MKKTTIIITILLLAGTFPLKAQTILGGHVTGNVQMDAQISREDTSIGAANVPQKFLSNIFGNVLYTNGNFTAGLRFESYLDPLLGFDSQYKGYGFANKFISFQNDKYEFTLGDFYEQYGNGLIYRSYEDRNLGLDNATMGINVKFRPINGISIKGMVGKQRYFWNYGPGIVRGIDGEFELNSLIPSWNEAKTQVSLGAGFVSKYEGDETVLNASDPDYKLNLPLNVGAASYRLNLTHGRFGLQTEYAMKTQDPNATNNYIYKGGNALLVMASYARRGLGINLQAKRVDNMGFKSKRSETGEMLYINYLPAMTRQHTYALMSIYPYATQVNGEMGIQADIAYNFRKGTFLGGKYGTDLKINYARLMSINRQAISDTTPIGTMGTDGYKSDFFKFGDELYYEDFNIEINKKLSPKAKLNLMYAYITFNPVVEGHSGSLHYNNVAVADFTYKINSKNVIRAEAQWLGTNIDYTSSDKRSGDWIMGLIEYNFTSEFFVSVSDQYNYNGGGQHYYNISAGYTHKTTRLQIGYGKQREGLLCIGGVCRQVPASNGLTISLTSSF